MLEQVLNRLSRSLINDFTSVNESKNPVAIAFPEYTYNQKLYVMVQYSTFSRYIINFLTEALYKASLEGHGPIAEEMKQNLSEELGISNMAPPHYMLLCRGFTDQLAIDLYALASSRATEIFQMGVLKAIRDGSAAHAAGVAYALESSAIPELEITRAMVFCLFTDRRVAVPESVSSFFETHIGDFEIGHRDRLRTACLACLKTPLEQSDFSGGFNRLMILMDEWWAGLAAETLQDQAGLI